MKFLIPVNHFLVDIVNSGPTKIGTKYMVRVSRFIVDVVDMVLIKIGMKYMVQADSSLVNIKIVVPTKTGMKYIVRANHFLVDVVDRRTYQRLGMFVQTILLINQRNCKRLPPKTCISLRVGIPSRDITFLYIIEKRALLLLGHIRAT